MKGFSTILILLFFNVALPAQKAVQVSEDSDTVFWYGYKNNYVSQFKLGLIESDNNDYSFRFWSSGLAVKVTLKEGQSFGEIIRFVEAYPDMKRKRRFTKRYPIATSKVEQIRHLIDSLQIEALPSDKNIRGWQQGLDGITYFTEFKKGELYTFKHYWTPTSQDGLMEAILFQSFITTIDSILDLSTNREKFEADIPFDSWSYPGSATAVVRVKPATKKKNGG